MSEDLFPEPEIALSSMPLCEHVAEDYVTTGLSLKEHPISFFRERLTRLGAIRNAELRNESSAARSKDHRRRPGAGAADAGTPRASSS